MIDPTTGKPIQIKRHTELLINQRVGSTAPKLLDGLVNKKAPKHTEVKEVAATGGKFLFHDASLEGNNKNNKRKRNWSVVDGDKIIEKINGSTDEGEINNVTCGNIAICKNICSLIENLQFSLR